MITRAKEKKARSAIGNVIELAATVAVAVGLALLIQAFVVKPYKIPSGSMVPTLAIYQRVLANRLDTSPSLGDIVVFHPPHGADLNGVCGSPSGGIGHPAACDVPTAAESHQTFVKRVVAGPGDRISVVDGHVILNGHREKDSYIRPCAPDQTECSFPKTITIPPGHYFMMGDNRGDSLDSRFWGPVPQKWIIGLAFFTYWPPDRIGFL